MKSLESESHNDDLLAKKKKKPGREVSQKIELARIDTFRRKKLEKYDTDHSGTLTVQELVDMTLKMSRMKAQRRWLIFAAIGSFIAFVIMSALIFAFSILAYRFVKDTAVVSYQGMLYLNIRRNK